MIWRIAAIAASASRPAWEADMESVSDEDRELGAMERLRSVRGVSWSWADPAHPSYREGRQLGVIAQELREVFPDLVREGPDGFLTVDYAGLLGPVIEALKELDARLSLIEERIALGREDRGALARRVGDHQPVTEEQS
jgi:hypothetical protein